MAMLHISYQRQNLTKRLTSTASLWAIALIISIMMPACHPDVSRDIRDYYFPLRQLAHGMVYEYRAADTLTPAYWYYRSIFKPGERYLTATYYEQELEPLQSARERMVSNGMLLEELRLYSPDTSGASRQTLVSVDYANVFPFEVRDSLGVFLYKVHWTDEEGQIITLTRNRRFAGDTTFLFRGKIRPAVVFRTVEALELDHPKQGFFEQILYGREVYAKGLGLVAYGKAPAGQFPVWYQLTDRYPMEVLEEKARGREFFGR